MTLVFVFRAEGAKAAKLTVEFPKSTVQFPKSTASFSGMTALDRQSTVPSVPFVPSVPSKAPKTLPAPSPFLPGDT